MNRNPSDVRDQCHGQYQADQAQDLTDLRISGREARLARLARCVNAGAEGSPPGVTRPED